MGDIAHMLKSDLYELIEESSNFSSARYILAGVHIEF